MKTSRAAGVQREEGEVVKEERAQCQLQDPAEEEGVEGVGEAGVGVEAEGVEAWAVLLDHFALAKEKKQIDFENSGKVFPAIWHVYIKHLKTKQ